MARIALAVALLIAALPSPIAADGPLQGTASWYHGTAGFTGQAGVALAGGLGGRYTGSVNAQVWVCADRCAVLPAYDYCQCYWGTSDQRLVDLTPSAWVAVSDAPLSQGLIEVSVEVLRTPLLLPDTAFAPSDTMIR